MSRLPVRGQDSGTWGGILNDYLSQSLNADGTLKPAAAPVQSVNGQTGAVTTTLAGASDVTITSPADAQVLTYDTATSKWNNKVAPSAPVTSVAGKTGAVTL